MEWSWHHEGNVSLYILFLSIYMCQLLKIYITWNCLVKLLYGQLMLDILICSWYIMRRQHLWGKSPECPMVNIHLTPFKCTHWRQVLVFLSLESWELHVFTLYIWTFSLSFFLISQERCSDTSTAESGSDMNDYSSPNRHRSCPYPHLAPVHEEVNLEPLNLIYLRSLILVFTSMHITCGCVLRF